MIIGIRCQAFNPRYKNVQIDKMYIRNNSTTTEANCLIEHRTLTEMLKATANEHQDWADQLPLPLLGLQAATVNSDRGNCFLSGAAQENGWS